MAIRKVRFRQSGGFAGLVRGCDVAGSDLTDTDRRALERHVSAGSVPAAGATSARDLIVYEIEVETGSGEVRLEFDESAVPADLTALVDTLAARARPMRP
jgi:hypothetical protein